MNTEHPDGWRDPNFSSEAEREAARGTEPETAARQTDRTDSVAGERDVPSMTRVRSMQSRVTTMLAIGLMSVMALGLLAWYYSKALTRSSREQTQAQATAQQRAKGDSPLPPLGMVAPSRSSADETSAMKRLMGPPPELPPQYRDLPPQPERYQGQYGPQNPTPAPQVTGPRPKSVAELELERRLAGPVSSSSPSGGRAQDSATPYIRETRPADPPRTTFPSSLAGLFGPQQPAPPAPASDSLSARLQPTSTPAALAQLLPTQRLLLPKGAFIDCTLETALTSALPGMPTCITATDTWSADGTVILLERGTKLIGESAGQAQQRGTSRIFVLWTQARTPTGVVIPLASPGTDELGRSGLPGTVNRHFFDRFGAAILISVIDGAIQAGANRDGGSTVILNPTGTQDVMTEVLRSTVNIPPTIEKHQGDRISIVVARDLDFRSVYELRPVVAGQ